MAAQTEMTTVNLKEHTERIVKVFDNTIEITKALYEAKGNNTLNSKNKKIKIGDEEIGIETLRTFISKVKAAIREIPRIVTKEEAAKRAAKRAAKGERTSRPLPPNQYRSELVNFFAKMDLGKASDGKHKLQEDAALELFFKNGIGNPMFGVSLFNVWGNIQKLKSGGTKVVLDTHARAALKDSLEALKTRCRDKISGATTDKERDSATSDLAALDAGEIQNKDYMCILSFYSVKENKEQLVGFTDAVSEMSKITSSLNEGYRNRIKESRPKPTKEPKLVAGADAPPKVPAVPVATKPSIPAIPTVGKTSPAPPTKTRK